MGLILPSSWEVIQAQELGSRVGTRVQTRPVLNTNYTPASSALANISKRLHEYELKIPSKCLHKKCVSTGKQGLQLFERDFYRSTM